MADNNSRTLTANFTADTSGFSPKINELVQKLKQASSEFEQNKTKIAALKTEMKTYQRELVKLENMNGPPTAAQAREMQQLRERIAACSTQQGIDGVLGLTAASGGDLVATSDIVTDAITAFGLKAEDCAHFADVLAAASSNANTNVSMMGETFKYCAPIAGALGFKAEDAALHETNIGQRVEIIIEHFRNYVSAELGGNAKAMVVTGSRPEAVKYYNAFLKYVESKGYTDVRPIVAFSDDKTQRLFDTAEYQVMIVANKYQTGFDQPKLCAMYILKKLNGVNAVQTLSRLNRICPPYEKKVFILDFVNTYFDKCVIILAKAL